MNILVTGGSGFIGTALIRDLLKAGHHTLIYDKKKSLSFPKNCIIADVRERDKLNQSLKGVDTVYHLAAEHLDDVTPVSLYYDVNVKGAENLVFACEQNSVSRLVFTSTVAVYGLNSSGPCEDNLLQPFNDYGKSKLESEQVFSKWAEEIIGRSLTIVRPAVVFGEGNRGNVYNLINQVGTERFVMIGNGKNRKSMGYVLNISKFLASFLNAKPGTEIYNFADKPDLTSEELIQTIFKALGRKPDIKLRLPYPIGLIGGYVFDCLSKLTGKKLPISSIRIKKFCADTSISTSKLEQTGFIPAYSLHEGLNRFITSDFV
jgi:GlcNAc-P-P-Und epimerase